MGDGALASPSDRIAVPRQRAVCAVLLGSVLWLLTCLCPPALAASVASRRITFHIPAQSLQQALLQFSQQAGMQLVAVGELDDGRRSAAVDGDMPAEDALRRLLDGQPFVFAVEDGIVTVSPAQPPDRPSSSPVSGAHPHREVSPPPLPPSLSDAVEFASLMVTARQRDERWIDVPMALGALTGEQIEALGLENVAAAVQMVPGVGTVDTGTSLTQVQIRGVSSSLGGNDNGYYLDSIPFTGVTVPWHPDTRSFDLDRMEVLKGPQGTLFGEGSMGGTVRILTRAPELDRLAARIETGVSSMDAGSTGYAVKSMANLPLQRDALALRVVATQEHLPGWIGRPDGGGAINRQHIDTQRARLRWGGDDARWTSDLTWMASQFDADGGGYGAGDAQLSEGVQPTRANWRGTSWDNALALSGSQLHGSLTDARLDYLIDGQVSPAAAMAGRIHIDVASRELRWASDGDAGTSWIVGVMQRRARRQDDFLINGEASFAAQTNRAHAVFGEMAVPLGAGAWSLTAGARYFVDELQGRAHAGSHQVALHGRFASINPRLAITRQAESGRLFYASVSRGFRSGQLQPLDSMAAAAEKGMALPAVIKPDSIVTWETGFKQLRDQGRLLWQGALFHSRWQALPVRVPVDDIFNGLVNSRGAVIDGAELGLVWTLRPATRLELGGSWVNASYLEDVPGTPLRKGAQVYNVPRWTLSLAVTHEWPIGESLRGTLAAAVVHHSRRRTSLVQGVPGDRILSARLRLGLESAHGWAVHLYGENLTDESGAVDGRDAFGQATRLRPRTLGMELGFSY